MPETTARPDPVQAARVRFCAAAFARRVMTIPPDASKRSRDTRIRHTRNRMIDLIRSLCQREVRTGGWRVTVFDEEEWNRWYRAHTDAWALVSDGRDAGDDLAAFLFPQEAADAA